MSGETWSRSSNGIRVEKALSVTLESIPQRKLNQARGAFCIHNLSKGIRCGARQVCLNVGHSRIREVNVVPQVEEVCSETEILFFPDREVLDQRKVPILLDRAAVDVATKIAKVRPTEIAGGIGSTLSRIKLRRRCKGQGIQIAIDALMNVAVSQALGDRCTWGQTRAKQRRAPSTKERRAGSRIEDREWSSRLENGHTADLPSAERGVDNAGGVRKQRQFVGVAHAQPMRTIVIGQSARGVDIALIVVCSVECSIAGGGGVDRLREGIGALKISATPPTRQC